MGNKFIENLKTRRSIRAYQDKMPPMESIKRVAEAGTYAPNGLGKQSAKIIVVTDKKLRNNKAEKILKDMGLGDRLNHKPGEMSGGQQQRVGIARAFVGRPKVIFADEPTGNLDSATTEQVMNMLIDISKKNEITFVMVTHDPELAKMAPRVITLKDGRVISDVKNYITEKTETEE